MCEINEVVDGLHCLVSVHHNCIGCKYNPHPGLKWPYGCIKGQNDIVEDAIRLIKDHEPQRKHGYWIPVDEKCDAFDCSECVAMVQKPTNYCPRCGSEMEVLEE